MLYFMLVLLLVSWLEFFSFWLVLLIKLFSLSIFLIYSFNLLITWFALCKLQTSNNYLSFIISLLSRSSIKFSFRGLKVQFEITSELTFFIFIKKRLVNFSQFVLHTIFNVVPESFKYFYNIFRIKPKNYILNLKLNSRLFLTRTQTFLDKVYDKHFLKILLFFKVPYTTLHDLIKFIFFSSKIVINKFISRFISLLYVQILLLFFLFRDVLSYTYILFITFFSKLFIKIRYFIYICLITTLFYFITAYVLHHNFIIIKFDILKYFYNSLFLHTLFVYGIILSTLFTCCTVHFDYFLELYHSMYYTLRMIWSTFFYTPEDFEEFDRQDIQKEANKNRYF